MPVSAAAADADTTPGDLLFSNQGMPDFMLCVDKIQADPFAAPSRFHVVVPGPVAGFPAEAFSTKARKDIHSSASRTGHIVCGQAME